MEAQLQLQPATASNSSSTSHSHSHSDDVLAQLQRIRANLASSDALAQVASLGPPTRPSSSSSILAPASPSKRRAPSSTSLAAPNRSAEALQQQHQDALRYATSRAQGLVAAAAARTGASGSGPSASSTPEAPSSAGIGATFIERAAAAQQRREQVAAQEERVRRERRAAAARARTQSGGFGQAPRPRSANGTGANDEHGQGGDEADGSGPGAARDERLALIESLEMGPRDLQPNADDPHWQRLEPYSGTRLRLRHLSHQQLTDHLQMRYHIPPSTLYSVAKPLFTASNASRSSWENQGRDGDYEVPVDGDWLTLAVIAEKSDIKTTKPKVRDQFGNPVTNGDDDPVSFRNAARGSDGKLNLDLDSGNERLSAYQRAQQRRADGRDDQEAYEENERRKQANRPRNFFFIKLVDISVYHGKAAHVGGTRGDTQLNLMSFQADEVDQTFRGITSDRAEVQEHLAALRKARRKYVNGSRGAFELLQRQPAGTLIAIMNPKILKPYKGNRQSDGADAGNVLTLVPRSADDILVVGQARDYGHCEAVRRDGTRCPTFVDRRQRSAATTSAEHCFCDFHLNQAVSTLRRDRMEFANSTGGMGFLPPGRSGSQDGFGFGKTKSKGNWSQGRGRGKSRSARFEAQLARHAEAKASYFRRQLNSGFGNLDDGLVANGGKTFTVESVEAARPSDPENWKFAVDDRFGRGRSEREARVRRRMEADDLEQRMVERFGPASQQAAARFGTASQRVTVRKRVDGAAATASSSSPPSSSTTTGLTSSTAATAAQKKQGDEGTGFEDAAVKLMDSQSSAARLLQDAQRTLEERKRKAEESKQTALEKRRRILGIKASSMGDEGGREGRREGGGVRSKRSALDPLTSDEDEQGGQRNGTGEGRSEARATPKGTDPTGEDREPTKRFSYSAEAIKLMGFDPLARRTTGPALPPSADAAQRKDRDSRSILLDRLNRSTQPSATSGRNGKGPDSPASRISEPSLRLQKRHRPKVKSSEDLEAEVAGRGRGRVGERVEAWRKVASGTGGEHGGLGGLGGGRGSTVEDDEEDDGLEIC